MLKKDNKTEKQVIDDLKKENQQLKDEVDSLWMMLDEMTKTDIENWSSILDELQLDVASRALMVTKKKVDC
jgi:flagellar motor switch protein FliG|tara:strand:+ start:735 stop:947 length:213 start_codon:yes stop_codon:yes gene_type:complete